MLRVIGVDLPRYALRVSGLVSLDKRVDFARRFVPALVARAQENPGAGALGEWIDRELASYGKDARGLTADAMRAFLASGARTRTRPRQRSTRSSRRSSRASRASGPRYTLPGREQPSPRMGRLMIAMSIVLFVRRHWALVVAGLLVIFVAGGASVARFARNRATRRPRCRRPARAAALGRRAAGKSTRKSVPTPMRESISIPPSWLRTIPSTAASPSPRPVNLVVKNGSKIREIVSCDMPQPESSTSRNT
jgi:hypothetical protein